MLIQGRHSLNIQNSQVLINKTHLKFLHELQVRLHCFKARWLAMFLSSDFNSYVQFPKCSQFPIQTEEWNNCMAIKNLLFLSLTNIHHNKPTLIMKNAQHLHSVLK
jgi:hypothetical protein